MRAFLTALTLVTLPAWSDAAPTWVDPTLRVAVELPEGWVEVAHPANDPGVVAALHATGADADIVLRIEEDAEVSAWERTLGPVDGDPIAVATLRSYEHDPVQLWRHATGGESHLLASLSGRGVEIAWHATGPPANADRVERDLRHIVATMTVLRPRPDAPFTTLPLRPADRLPVVRVLLSDPARRVAVSAGSAFVMLYPSDLDDGEAQAVADRAERFDRFVSTELSVPPKPVGSPAGLVWVYRDREPFLQAGGQHRTTAHLDPWSDHIALLYERSRRQTQLQPAMFGVITLRALHAARPPDSASARAAWFSHALAQLYAGARELDDGSFVLGPNDERVATLRRPAGHPLWLPLLRYLALDDRTIRTHPETHLTQGWSLLYFLHAIVPGSTDLASRYGDILPGWKKSPPTADPATDPALAGVDLDALEEDWRGWIGKIR